MQLLQTWSFLDWNQALHFILFLHVLKCQNIEMQSRAATSTALAHLSSTYHLPAHLAWYWPMIWQQESLLEEQELQALAGSVALLAVWKQEEIICEGTSLIAKNASESRGYKKHTFNFQRRNSTGCLILVSLSKYSPLWSPVVGQAGWTTEELKWEVCMNLAYIKSESSPFKNSSREGWLYLFMIWL